ncbi:MAG: type I-C CRISPR-associated protein Cas7/Csd2 [Oscillospiraceae bacterium]|nr:type I-C CRISPR-associated protein Cas7/Csd2 [Oscillospiraceae bacterium]MDD7278173.1 type I-C CRISPR-associated protein Cas7/Csd2 [Oscillospiraceae bacterium]MDY2863599.1 type I-C CRISPR-associated protein Cas7/Csd2 [Oscillospiraceae bacterium]
MSAIENRYEFVMLFDVENGNPNGDPDAGNLPRVDSETAHGIVTDVCLKRKIRNFVEIYKEGEPSYNILMKSDRSLNSKFTAAYDACGLEKKNKGKNPDDVEKARKYMCENYFDVRTFGAVMSTGDDPCGIVRGPVQINFAKSLDPVFEQDITITRQAITTDADFNDKGKRTEMGKKHYVPYGLYRAEGYISAMLAQKVTGFSEDDLELLWTAIINMFEHDRSAARGKMCMRKLYVFKHSNALGNCPAHILTDKISCIFTPTDDKRVPRSFSDYVITVDRNMPEGVELIEKL